MTDNYRFIIAVDIQADDLNEAYRKLYDQMGPTTPWESTDEAYGPDGLDIDIGALREARLAKFNVECGCAGCDTCGEHCVVGCPSGQGVECTAKAGILATAAQAAFRGKPNKDNTWVVRVFDGFDTQWTDCTKPISKDEALGVWLRETEGGTKRTNFSHIDYYAIFPSDMEMEYAGGRGATDR